MANAPTVIFTPSGKRGQVAVGTSVLEAARAIGVDLDSVCGGRGICSKCQISPGVGAFPKHGITVTENALSDWNKVEERYDQKRGLPKGRRLGCQAKILSDVVIDVPPESQVHKQVIRKDAAARTIQMDPATRLYVVDVQQPDMQDPSGDLERLSDALADQWGIENIRTEHQVLARLQTALRKGEWTVTLAIFQDHRDGAARLLDLWPGVFTGPLYGLAIDLGSTTIAAHLCDLTDGRVVASSGLMNPQIRFGEDLMSRVSYAMMNPGGNLEMTRVVHEALGELAQTVATDAEVEPEHILETVLVCNPVMHHLLLGIDPVELGQAPFTLAVSQSLALPARDIGITTINHAARTYILPCIAGHVGADAAGVALSEEPHKSEDLVLIVDVGTNAEIILGNKTRVLTCSSPTGPAFEGAQISAGQRAAPGAIERVEINAASKSPRFRVVGSDIWSDEPGFHEALGATGVTGICGSGIIEVIAEMRMAGIVDASGLVGSAEQTNCEHCVAEGRTHSFMLYPETADGAAAIMVTQGDIRAIQLAKSALYAGARLLMDEMGVEHVDRVVLAGAFGAHISPKHALVLGMIPDVATSKVASGGNAAGTGARIALCNRQSRSDVEDLVRQITKVETAIEPRFQEHFIAASAIPHSTDSFAKLRAVVDLPDVSFNAAAGNSRRRRRRD